MNTGQLLTQARLRVRIQEAVLERFIELAEPSTRSDIAEFLDLSSVQRLTAFNLDEIYGLVRVRPKTKGSPPAWEPSPEILRRTIVSLRDALAVITEPGRDGDLIVQVSRPTELTFIERDEEGTPL